MGITLSHFQIYFSETIHNDFMKPFAICCFLLFSCFHSQAQNDSIFDILISKYKKSDDNTVYFYKETKKVDTVVAHLEFLKDTYRELNKFTGKLHFSFKLKDSESQEQTDLTIGANITKGVYPGELNFNSLLNVQLLNGKFIENVSNLSMSYDHHLNNEIDTEAYIFLRRSSNNFLSIDQRYEIGAGVTLNLYSGEYATKDKYDDNQLDKVLKDDGVKKFKKLLKFASKEEEEEEILKGSYAPLCVEDDCLKNNITVKESKIFNKVYRNITTGIRKQQSLWRASLLAGINYEIERSPDSLQLRYRDSVRVQFFEPKELIRLVLGPKVEAQINELNIESVCYFKLGFFNDNLKDEITNTEINNTDIPLSDTRTDYRVEWNTKASIKVSKKISINAILAYTWINAPRRRYYNFPTDSNMFELFRADRRYLNFTAGFEYKL